jgi:murein DD-endopeptidase MepM/ murein hydrolase activator NlpD
MKYLTLSMMILLVACNVSRIPQEKLSQYTLNLDYRFTDDSVTILLQNTLRCPMRVWIQSEDDRLYKSFQKINPVTLIALQDTVIRFEIKGLLQSRNIVFASRYGDVNEDVTATKVELPFQHNREYVLIQGYDSQPTHNTDWSRYAMDFGLSLGDTVCAAAPGFVVGVIEDYMHGGPKEEWKNFANVITIYTPGTGLFTQYVHLDHKGSLVQLGDSVVAGQKIGLAGMTGYTNIEHLHFNCLKPIQSEAGLISIPIDSIGSYRVSEMKRNMVLSNSR